MLSKNKSFFIYSVKETSNCQSHFKDHHPNVYSGTIEEVKKARKLINAVIKEKRFNNKGSRGIKRERGGDSSMKFKGVWRDMTPLVYLEGLWCLMRNRPDLIVNDPEYRDIKRFLNAGAPMKDRKTIVRAQSVIHGFVFEAIEKRINESAKFFYHQPFISLQGDAWTSQGNKTYFGISASYYDIKTERVETIVIYCAPLINGKRASDLKKIVGSCLSMLNISENYVLQACSDDEGAVRNTFKQRFPTSIYSTCLCHKLQTCLRHGLALGATDYADDSFPEAFEWWSKIKAYVAVFTRSPKKLRNLFEIIKKMKEPNEEVLTILKFCTTR